jgi:DNA-binding CsgD family transcriptional regulator
MQRLDASDERRVGRFVAEAATFEACHEPFPAPFLSALGRLVPCDSVTFSELDRVRRRVLGSVEEPAWDGPEPGVSYWEIRHEHPACHVHETTGDFRAHRVSDFMTTRELHRTRLYAEWFRPQGVEEQLTVGLDAPLWHTKVFLFSRETARAFDDRDCAVLDVLRPYLDSRYQLWDAQRRLAAARREADAPGALTTRERQVIELVADGLTNAEVAERLWISPGTVRRHLENVYAKLGVHTRTAAVRAFGPRS